ncbi:MAG: hypothetical protein MJ072_02665, partial [Clostridia bacterium]|nr:hypothetical protein [Clostridia bacterium]
GSFDFSDATDEICRKLIERHPHIFSDTVADNADEVLKNWDAIKEETKKRDSAFTVLDPVAKSLADVPRAELKRWYNGYRFAKYDGTMAYNPVSIGQRISGRSNSRNYYDDRKFFR